MSASFEFAEEYARFVTGQTFRYSGIDFRVMAGAKTSKDGRHNDLRIDWRCPEGWRPIGFDVLAVLTDFFHENEERLYPTHLGYEGGEKVRNFIREAIKVGHEQAIRNLEWEKRHKGTQPRLWGDD